MIKTFPILIVALILCSCGGKQEDRTKSKAEAENCLRLAASNGDTDKVKELIATGVNVNATDDLGRTPLDLALDASTPYMALMLVESGSRLGKEIPANVAQAAMVGDINAIRDFLHAGADVNLKDKHGRTALHYAARRGDMVMVQLLIENSADLNIIEPSWSDTPLHQALRRGHNDMAKLLIASGADINARARWGWTPLHLEAYSGNKEMVSVLIAEGADINSEDRDDMTPLDWAKSDDVRKLLRSHGAVSGKELDRNEDE